MRAYIERISTIFIDGFTLTWLQNTRDMSVYTKRDLGTICENDGKTTHFTKLGRITETFTDPTTNIYLRKTGIDSIFFWINDKLTTTPQVAVDCVWLLRRSASAVSFWPQRDTISGRDFQNHQLDLVINLT